MGKKEEIPTVSKTVLMPDPMNGRAANNKRVSIASSVTSDVSTDDGEAVDVKYLPHKKSKLRRWGTAVLYWIQCILLPLLSLLGCSCFSLWDNRCPRTFVVVGFFLAYEDFKMFDDSFPACAFFFKVEIGMCTLIPLFRPGSVYSGSAKRDDCDEYSLTSCV